MEIPYINTELLARTPFEVIITRTISPSYFWVHLHNSARDFVELLEELQLRMRLRRITLLMWPDRVREGEICAVDTGSDINNEWHRGIIIKDLGDGVVLVSLRDWGVMMQRRKHHLYTLEDRFRELPWQAIPCGLAYAVPATLEPYWPKKTNTMLRLLCERKREWMLIRGSAGTRNEGAYVDLKIKMENEGEIMYIRTLLKSLGYTRNAKEIKPETQPRFSNGLS